MKIQKLKKYAIISIVIVVVLAGTALAIHIQNDNQENAYVENLFKGEVCEKLISYEYSNQPVQNTFMNVNYSVLTARSLSDMIHFAEIIVIGRYIGFDSTWNMARSPHNVLEEDPNRRVEGRIYRFAIEEILRGNPSSTEILIAHSYSKTRDIVTQRGVITHGETKNNEFTITTRDPLFIEPELNATYILFLGASRNFEHYLPAIYPYSIKFAQDNIAELQSTLVDKPVEGFREIIELDDGSHFTLSINRGSIMPDNISNQSFADIRQQIEVYVTELELNPQLSPWYNVGDSLFTTTDGHIIDWNDDAAIEAYLERLLEGLRATE